MKPFFPLLLLIFAGLLVEILARPFEHLAELGRISQQGLSRLMSKRPSFKKSGLPRSTGSVPGRVAHV